MKQLFSAYPAGLAGGALLLFRCSAALFAATAAAEILLLRQWPAYLLDMVAILLAVGLGTRIIAALSAVASIAMLGAGGCAMPALVVAHVLNAAALAMIGPGAFSIDARLFGRSTISLPR